jgi:hypothetical protein
VPSSGYALNIDAAGRLVAAFPFDTLTWTETVSRSLKRLSAEVSAQHPKRLKLFASVGALSPPAQAELKKLGWQILKLD